MDNPNARSVQETIAIVQNRNSEIDIMLNLFIEYVICFLRFKFRIFFPALKIFVGYM
jgi:hypothetical protein